MKADTASRTGPTPDYAAHRRLVADYEAARAQGRAAVWTLVRRTGYKHRDSLRKGYQHAVRSLAALQKDSPTMAVDVLEVLRAARAWVESAVAPLRPLSPVACEPGEALLKRIDAALTTHSTGVAGVAAEPVAWRTDILNLCNSVIGNAFLGYEAECDLAQKVKATLLAAAPTPPAGGGETEATDELVEQFASALKAKLRASEAKYGWRNGWREDGWENDCQRDLARHVQKGDPLDVAAYAAFCWHHGWKTAEPSPASPAGDLISLSAGAPAGPWSEPSKPYDSFPWMHAYAADNKHLMHADRSDEERTAANALAIRLVNLYRSGRLVEAAPAAPRKGPSEEEIADLEDRIRLKASEPCFRQFQDALGANLTEAGYLLGFKLRPTGTTSMWVRLSSGREIIVDESEWLSAAITPADRGETQAVGDGADV